MSYVDPLECYEVLGTTLADHAGDDWNCVRAEANMDGHSVDLLVFVETASGEQVNLPYVPMLARHFFDLRKLVSSEDKGLFNRCVFTVYSNGEFNVEFEY